MLGHAYAALKRGQNQQSSCLDIDIGPHHTSDLPPFQRIFDGVLPCLGRTRPADSGFGASAL
jgi:hypothetical protein